MSRLADWEAGGGPKSFCNYCKPNPCDVCPRKVFASETIDAEQAEACIDALAFCVTWQEAQPVGLDMSGVLGVMSGLDPVWRAHLVPDLAHVILNAMRRKRPLDFNGEPEDDG